MATQSGTIVKTIPRCPCNPWALQSWWMTLTNKQCMDSSNQCMGNSNKCMDSQDSQVLGLWTRCTMVVKVKWDKMLISCVNKIQKHWAIRFKKRYSGSSRDAVVTLQIWLPRSRSKWRGSIKFKLALLKAVQTNLFKTAPITLPVEEVDVEKRVCARSISRHSIESVWSLG